VKASLKQLYAGEILKILKLEFPDAHCRLDHKNALELLVATILAAQCTDERVNIVTKNLFSKYKTAADYAEGEQEILETDIRSTGFFRNKARSIIAMGKTLVGQYGGKLPESIDELVKIPGVGRKTANVLIGTVFGGPAIIVDTHFKRVMNRMGLSGQKNPDKIEVDIRKLLPEKSQTVFSHVVNFHGRLVCQTRKPKCGECKITKFCDFFQAAPENTINGEQT